MFKSPSQPCEHVHFITMQAIGSVNFKYLCGCHCDHTVANAESRQNGARTRNMKFHRLFSATIFFLTFCHRNRVSLGPFLDPFYVAVTEAPREQIASKRESELTQSWWQTNIKVFSQCELATILPIPSGKETILTNVTPPLI